MTIQEFYKKYNIFDENRLLGLRERDTNKVIIIPTCQMIHPVRPYFDCDKLYLKIKRKGKYSLYNLSGEKISEEYDYLGDYNKGVIPFNQDFVWGILNAEGKVFIEAKFERVERLTFGKFIVRQNNKWGIVSELGMEVPPIYDRIFIGYEKIQGMQKGKTEEIII